MIREAHGGSKLSGIDRVIPDRSYAESTGQVGVGPVRPDVDLERSPGYQGMKEPGASEALNSGSRCTITGPISGFGADSSLFAAAANRSSSPYHRPASRSCAPRQIRTTSDARAERSATAVAAVSEIRRSSRGLGQGLFCCRVVGDGPEYTRCFVQGCPEGCGDEDA